MLIKLIIEFFTQKQPWQKSNLSGKVLRIAILALIGAVRTVCAAESINAPPPLVIPPLESHAQSNTTTPEYVVIQPTDQVTFSSETAASVDTISVKEGNNFKAGDILIKLDCRVQDAELKKAIAQKQATKSAFESAKKLKSYGSISNFEYLQAQSQNTMADADVDKLEAIVDKCTIKAPFNGAVAKLSVHLHEAVKPGDPLIRIVSIDNLDFVMQIPSTWLEWLRIGTEFNVHVNEIDKSVTVKVAEINPEIDSVSQTVKIIGKEAGETHDPALLPGMSGQATFPNKPSNQPSKLN